MSGNLHALYERSWGRKIPNDLVVRQEGIGAGSRIGEAASIVGTGERLLDIGCRDGTFASLLRDRFRHLYGVDIAESALDVARGRGVMVAQADLNTGLLPFADGYFDVVTCLDVLEHVIDPHHLVAEARRVTASGGIFVLHVPNLRYLKYLIKLVILGDFPRTSLDVFGYDGGHLHYFTLRNINRLLEANGFSVESSAGVIPTRKLIPLRRYHRHALVREFFSAGLLVRAT